MSFRNSLTDSVQRVECDLRMTEKQSPNEAPATFIDLFAGCGGLSLGLSQAGWRGLFAIERAEDAFQTFRANFLEGGGFSRFDWPEWLEQRPYQIEDVLEQKKGEIARLRGSVDLIAGGPPCQGFSFAGRRSASDPRNLMFQKYVQFVDLVRPKFLVLENVPGMNVAHRDGRGTHRRTYYQKLLEELGAIGYDASGYILDAADFGVPQRRARLVVLGMYRGDGADRGANPRAASLVPAIEGLFQNALRAGSQQLQAFGVHRVTAVHAISDLEMGSGISPDTICYQGSQSRSGYRQVRYAGPNTTYQECMHKGARAMDSMRLARHSESVRARFAKILELTQGRRGVNMSAELRSALGMLKHRTVPMDPHRVAPTLTTLPDDVLHYSEPRILTVREYARLQSFPDSFVFRGKYTTGGAKRRLESPRYTQIGNAVPPLLGRAIGLSLMEQLRTIRIERPQDVPDALRKSGKGCSLTFTAET